MPLWHELEHVQPTTALHYRPLRKIWITGLSGKQKSNISGEWVEVYICLTMSEKTEKGKKIIKGNVWEVKQVLLSRVRRRWSSPVDLDGHQWRRRRGRFIFFCLTSSFGLLTDQPLGLSPPYLLILQCLLQVSNFCSRLCHLCLCLRELFWQFQRIRDRLRGLASEPCNFLDEAFNDDFGRFGRATGSLLVWMRCSLLVACYFHPTKGRRCMIRIPVFPFAVVGVWWVIHALIPVIVVPSLRGRQRSSIPKMPSWHFPWSASPSDWITQFTWSLRCRCRRDGTSVIERRALITHRAFFVSSTFPRSLCSRRCVQVDSPVRTKARICHGSRLSLEESI